MRLRGLKIRILGLSEAMAYWERVSADLNDPWKLVGPDIQNDFIKEVRGRYNTRGRGTWPALSEPYATYKASVRPSAGLMVFDGNLKRSLTNKRDNRFHFRRTRRAMEIGSNVGYSGVHQVGAPEINLPARPLFVLTREIARRWTGFLAEKVFRK